MSTITIERPASATTPARRLPGIAVLVMGALAGAALGIAARAWMRVITEHPEFTWNGTMFIVVGFTLFGTAQAGAVVGRRSRHRAVTTTARVIACVAMMPLFGAAGSIMLPTVIGGGLALARNDWPRPLRCLLTLVALAPVAFVAHEIVDGFGWSWRTPAGLAGFLCIYATLVVAIRPAFAPVPGRRMSRIAKVALAIVVVAVLLAGVALAGSGA
ncbi:MAG: hypothetical protein QM733_01465 [Ilumatobacteraceae bacterium]